MKLYQISQRRAKTKIVEYRHGCFIIAGGRAGLTGYWLLAIISVGFRLAIVV
ncbi:hypothetical protein [Thermincola potens]|uniref:hypothetical protein n=1 Tax=Thermincola potens TaxID=863643 RepID=UPI0002EBB7FD|nr:hypothetical protein [Thermincola potens]